VVSTPLKSEGEAIGVLALATRRSRVFTPEEIELLASIGGQLGLAVRNSVLYARAEQRGQDLAALLAVARATAASFELPKLLDEALDAVLEGTTAETAELWLSDGAGNLTLACVRGVAASAFREVARLAPGEGLPGVAAESGSLVRVHELGADPRFVRPAVLEAGFQTYAALPLRHRGASVGVLSVASRKADALSSAAEGRLLAGIAEQLALSIDNARLYQRVLDIAVIEERERIARELHDGVAQVLGYINTQTMAIRRLLEVNRNDQAQRELSAMEIAARSAYQDVREAILGLRALSQLQSGLPDSLRTYASRFSEMAHLRVNIEVGGDLDGNVIPKAAEIQIMRIVQEALTNVRRHANAGAATVRLEKLDESIVVSVTDDGEGFDPDVVATAGSPTFGLQSMRERAESIGGTLKVRSARGSGTTVTVEVPAKNNGEGGRESSAR
jgi:signal transduction histidine kinase